MTTTFFLGRFSKVKPPDRESPRSAPIVKQTAVTAGDWGQFALLLVDVQHEFFTPDLQSLHEEYGRNVSDLLEFCRIQGIEVVHLRTEFASFDDLPPSYKLIFYDRLPCLRGSHGVLPAAFARDRDGEHVFHKSNFNGFSVDALQQHLDAGGKRHLLVAGLTTDLCVFATVLGALDNGYMVSVVEDCCLANNASAHSFIVQRYGGFLFDTVAHNEIPQHKQRWLEELSFVSQEVTLETP